MNYLHKKIKEQQERNAIFKNLEVFEAASQATAVLNNLPYNWTWLEAADDDDKAEWFSLFQSAISMEEIVEELEKIAEEEGRGRHLPITNFRQNFERPKWLVKDWIPSKGVTLLTGKGGTGKSRILLQLACHAAVGEKEWLGIEQDEDEYVQGKINAYASNSMDLIVPDEGVSVLWVSWEETAGMVQQRMLGDQEEDPFAVGCAPAGAVSKNFNDNMVFWRAKSGIWEPGLDGKSTHTSTAGDLTKCANYVKAMVKEHNMKIVIFDPLAAAYRVNENDRALVRAFLSEMDDWSEEVGCAVIIAAHPPKSEELFSGSTDWINAPRGSINFRLCEWSSWNPASSDDEGTISKPKDKKKLPYGMRLILMKRNHKTGKVPPLWLSGAPKWQQTHPRLSCEWHAKTSLPDENGSEWENK